jgi:4-hydroxybenzoate polyprenyltransferase
LALDQSTGGKFQDLMNLIRFEHTLFALPFAAAGALLGADGVPTLRQSWWILVCMVTARSAAMAYNRVVDRDIDARNPRTASREIPSGKISVKFAYSFTAVMSVVFMFGAWMLNPLAAMLSPVALAIVFGYSHAKRFTAYAHVWLGLALAIAPVGAWIAVTGGLAVAPIVLAIAVICWLIGFDTLYALQDVDFDRKAGLHSIPVRFGDSGALAIARISHLAMFVALCCLPLTTHLVWPYWVAVGGVGCLLAYEHIVMDPADIRKVNLAFFNCNVAISIILMSGIWISLYV